MIKNAFFLLLFLLASPAWSGADIVVAQILFDSGAKPMSVDETKAFFKPGAQIQTFAPGSGSVRYWKNDESGKFIASRQGGTGNARSIGQGEWKITDSGQYCVVIEWRTARGAPDNSEQWCRVPYRHDGEIYLAPRELAVNVEKKYSVVRVSP